MKIAIPTENNQIFQHFGQSSQFTIFSVADGEIDNKFLLEAGVSGHSALAVLMNNAGIDVVICGGIGGGAKMKLDTLGIKLIAGAEGSAEDAVLAYLSGQLKDNGSSCGHHHHDEHHSHGHDCGNCHSHNHGDCH